MQLKALERYKGLIEDLFPRAYQLLCKEQKFLGGRNPASLPSSRLTGDAGRLARASF